MPSVADLLRMIAVLFVALGAPQRMMARARKLDRLGLFSFMYALQWMQKRGILLRRPGEDLAAVAARIDLVIWIAHDPLGALKTRVRTMRGWKRARYGAVAPSAWGAVRLWLRPIAPCEADVAFADSS
jgi:hypothetical protein